MKKTFSHPEPSRAGVRQLLGQPWLVVTVLSLLLVTGLHQLWLMWPSLVISSIQWQREINAELSDLLYDFKSDPYVAGGYLVGLSFLYGLLHSLGPGHGKVIVATYLATHPTKVRASLLLTVVSALCQALVAVLLVSILVWGLSASMQAVNQKAGTLVSFSFALVAILGAVICWKAVKRIAHSMHQAKLKVSTPPLPISISSDKSKQLTQESVLHCSALPSMGGECHDGETHHHTSHVEAVNGASNWKDYIGIVATIGVRPCTGAIMVLLFANMIGLYWVGIVSAVVMGIGTAVTTSLIAMMTLTGKHLIKHYLVADNRGGKLGWKLACYGLQLMAGLALMIFGLLFVGGQSSGIAPMFSL